MLLATLVIRMKSQLLCIHISWSDFNSFFNWCKLPFTRLLDQVWMVYWSFVCFGGINKCTRTIISRVDVQMLNVMHRITYSFANFNGATATVLMAVISFVQRLDNNVKEAVCFIASWVSPQPTPPTKIMSIHIIVWISSGYRGQYYDLVLLQGQ